MSSPSAHPPRPFPTLVCLKGIIETMGALLCSSWLPSGWACSFSFPCWMASAVMWAGNGVGSCGDEKWVEASSWPCYAADHSMAWGLMGLPSFPAWLPSVSVQPMQGIAGPCCRKCLQKQLSQIPFNRGWLRKGCVLQVLGRRSAGLVRQP